MFPSHDTGRDINEVRTPRNSRSTPVDVTNTISINEVLSDEQLATQRMAQAQKMAADAKQLLAEADRLMKEASELSGAKKENGGTKTKKTAKVKAS